MFLPNLVEDVFLSIKLKGTYNLYIRKKGSNKLVLVATFYEEWHAIRARHLFRLVYGLKPSEVSKSDYMYDMPAREAQMKEKAHVLNLKSSNKVVRQHEQFLSELTAVVLLEKPHEWASRMLCELNKRELKELNERESHEQRTI